jgi:hypothetical protein
VLLVVEPEHRDTLETSPDFATLAEPRRRVSAATTALDCLAASRASRRRNPCLNSWPETLDCEDHVWFEDRWMVASLCDE